MQVIHEKCEKKVADDKKLPKSSYLVTYVVEEKLTHDIVIAVKDKDLEDMYDIPFEVVEEAYPDIEWGGRS